MRATLRLNSPIFFRIHGLPVLASLALFAATLCWTQTLPAQAPVTSTQPAPAHKVAHKHKNAAKNPAQQTAQQPVPLPEPPPAPVMPLWPANEKPVNAAVTWDSQGLFINAANSSLRQILKDVATATGATVEGLDADQRVFGVYGPGKARDVLMQLLHGTSYNVLMIGDQGEGTPRDIVLSTRRAAGNTPGTPNPVPSQAFDEDADVDDPPPQPQQQLPSRPSVFGPGGQRNPQQMQQMRPQPGQPQPQPPNNPQ